MRKIGKAAETAGLYVEYVLCSGDPDSLDGVYLPERRLGFTDGTSPHVQEPKYPGVCGAYLDLGRFYDTKALISMRETFFRLTEAYRAKYAEAYAALSALKPAITSREVPKTRIRRRFRTAVTCKGVVTLDPAKRPDEEVVFLHPLLPEYQDPAERPAVLPDCSVAITALQGAKSLHDELEHLYRPHVNFEGLEDEAERIIASIF